MLRLLASCPHNGFPVLDAASGAPQGLVLRRTLLALMRAQLGGGLPQPGGGLALDWRASDLPKCQ